MGFLIIFVLVALLTTLHFVESAKASSKPYSVIQTDEYIYSITTSNSTIMTSVRCMITGDYAFQVFSFINGAWERTQLVESKFSVSPTLSLYKDTTAVGCGNYVFLYHYNPVSGWYQQSVIKFEFDFNRFGASVALYENFLVVVGKMDLVEDSVAYFYSRESGEWKLDNKVGLPPTESTEVTIAVAISEHIAVISMYNKVYVYERTVRPEDSGWIKQGEISLPMYNNTEDEVIKYSVAVDKSLVLIGDKLKDVVYVYEYNENNWELRTEIKSPNTNMLNNFGSLVASSEKFTVVMGISNEEYKSSLYVYNA